ncbi:MAG: hypothetical protein NZT92_19765, partial [Abditibacteriales bacterium]|nr:hypothetical protein [Abditibacteriales bacterium]MDW8367948.1 hypothetical protein [Abditibacteriales bacterium]
VWATGRTVGECRRELQTVLEDWLLLKVYDHDPLPVIDGIDLNLKAACNVTSFAETGSDSEVARLALQARAQGQNMSLW